MAAEKFDAGYGAITWPERFGGTDLPVAYEHAFMEEEAAFATPALHETFSVTVRLIAPTIRLHGDEGQRQRFIRRFLRTDELCCQLFSEPDAGSDLAGLATTAVRDGDEWVINGEKVWTSGARFSAWGELIARTDPDVPKHAGLTAFLVPLDTPGLEVRGDPPDVGWLVLQLGALRRRAHTRRPAPRRGRRRVADRADDARPRADGHGSRAIGGQWSQVLALARWAGRTGDPVVRQRLAELYIQSRVTELVRQRTSLLDAAGEAPGPTGSIVKLRWTRDLTATSDVVAQLLGPRLAADTGEWGTYAWSAHVLGAPGYRIAGGSDEIQRNIVGERVLGLPAEPRVDRDRPWREVPRSTTDTRRRALVHSSTVIAPSGHEIAASCAWSSRPGGTSTALPRMVTNPSSSHVSTSGASA